MNSLVFDKNYLLMIKNYKVRKRLYSNVFKKCGWLFRKLEQPLFRGSFEFLKVIWYKADSCFNEVGTHKAGAPQGSEIRTMAASVKSLKIHALKTTRIFQIF